MRLNRIKSLLLLLGDIGLLYFTLYATLLIRYRGLPTDNVWQENFAPFSLLFFVWMLIYFINGLYDIGTSKNDIQFYNKILRNIIISFGIAAAYFYLLTDRLFAIKPRAVFFIYMGLFAVLFSFWRYWFNSSVQKPTRLKNVLVFGMNDEAKELVEEIIKKPQLGYRIKAVIHDGYHGNASFPNVTHYTSDADLKELLAQEKISTIVTVLDPHANPQLVQQLFENLSLRLQFYDLPKFYEILTGKIPVTTIGHIWFIENLTESEKGFYETGKRIFDIVFAAVLLLVSLPFIPLIALAIKIDSRGPVFFRQIRTGALGKEFNAMKFRSMIIGAEQNGQAQWAQANDPRITRVGNFLRKTRIDEIPQLINVLRGEMSVVGPRPERPEFVQKLQEIIPFYNERHLVKPGLTGWAQIGFKYGASVQDSLKKLQYDLFYIKNRSFALDVGILLKTVNIILSGKGQ